MATVQQLVDRIEKERAAASPRDDSGALTVPNIPAVKSRVKEHPDSDTRYALAESNASGSSTPTRKVAASGVVGALTVILAAVGSRFGFDVSPEMSSAVTMVVMALIGYFTKDKAK